MRYLKALAIVIATASLALAQVDTARMSGVVTDVTGAVLPDVPLVITHVSTNQQFRVTTNAQGQYVAVNLPVGSYTIRAELQGFKTAIRRGVTLQVDQAAVVDITLELGDLTEQIEVTADAPLVDPSRASQGQVIDNKKIVDLPLNGRDYVQLALLSAGAVQPTGGRYGGFSASGQRTTQNNYLLDGMDNNSLQAAGEAERAEAVKPSIDAIQEFKVATNSYSAEFGRAAGGVLNLTIKSGSNDIHGTVFEFLRNENLDARNFFDPQDVPPFKRNQFGFSLGGPIVKNKTFFFGDLEIMRRRESVTEVSTIPTSRMRQGDFSGTGEPVFDPATFDPATGARDPFPDNQIPQSRFDPVTRQLLDFYPEPQTSELTRNFTFNGPDSEDMERWDVRIDHIVSAKDSIYGRVSNQEQDLPGPPRLPGVAFLDPSFSNTGWNTVLVWNHTFSPTLVTNSRVGYNLVDTDRTIDREENFNALLGIQGVDQNLPGGFANFAITGFANVGRGTFAPIFSDSQVRQASSDTTWVHGSHTTKFGVKFQALQQNNVNPQQRVGNFLFDGGFTRNPAGNIGGNGLADLFLGLPFRTDFSTGIHIAGRADLHAFYVQDDWKVTDRLTLNLGLRWEVFSPFVDKFDNIANFDIDTDPNNPRLVLANPDGSRFERALTSTDKNNFGPRFGFAYRLRPGTILRGGYGIFYANYEPVGDGRNIQANPPFSRIIRISTDRITPRIRIQEGLPPNIVAPENLSDVRLTSLERDPALPLSQQWNFNIQKKFGRDWMWEIGYFGSKTNHLVFETNPNPAVPGPGNINERRRLKGFIFPGTDVFVSPMAEVVRRGFNGNSTFHSLQTKVEKRFSDGLSVLGSYIFSRTIGDTCGFATRGNSPGCLRTGGQNPLDLQAEKGLDNQHVKHRFVMNAIWDLPFGQGRRWGSNWGGALNAAFGGWTLASIVTLTSGQPFSVVVAGDPANIGQGTRANLVGDPQPDAFQDSLNEYFNTAAFAAPEPFTFGNLGRNTLTGPSLKNVDFATYKRFFLTEGLDLQFRFEAFNFFNRANFNFPGNTLGTAQFAQISSARTARKLQFGLKLVF